MRIKKWVVLDRPYVKMEFNPPHYIQDCNILAIGDSPRDTMSIYKDKWPEDRFIYEASIDDRYLTDGIIQFYEIDTAHCWYVGENPQIALHGLKEGEKVNGYDWEYVRP
jgi:hypothetical protein